LTALLFAFVVGFPTLGSAAAHVLPRTSVRVLQNGRREPGIGLRSNGHSWRLNLGDTAGATSVALIDETAPSHEKWVLDIDGNSLELDTERFVGGHAYLVEVCKGPDVVEHGLVYLYPSPPSRSRTAHVTLDARADDNQPESAELPITPKGAL
jgi:hypothetical protein